MKEINWNIFRAKFNGKETSTFESLSYQLFCFEYGIKIGIFRFKNQTGIETEPIIVKDKTIGFQAKFYDTKVSENKADIIDSLRKAKRENLKLDIVLLYINQEVSESTTKGKKDPEYKTEIEKEAKKIGLTIEWRVPSHFERQLALPENQYLANYFFTLERSILDFLGEIEAHTTNLIHPIQTDILFNELSIKINREAELSSVETWIGNSKAIIVSGEGGSGKTALIKELYQKSYLTFPFYGFKAAEFNIESIQSLFHNYGNFSLSDFIDAHKEESKKVLLIDSAEKISDLENQEPFKEFLSALLKDNWTVIFTTRLSYLDDLRFQFISVFRIQFQEISIHNLTKRDLELLASQYLFELPTNEKLKILIQNPFYLDEYLRNYASTGNLPTYSQFKDGIWLRKIQNISFTKNNTHILRERCFLSIVKSRTELDSFFVPGDQCSDEILDLLQKDEILAFNRNSGGYFITHDIYEEWGHNILIERAFIASDEYKNFLDVIGNSLSIRRAFRGWLSDKLYENVAEIREFIEFGFNNSDIESYWKDEILTSVLLSEYSSEFFTLNSDLILAKDHQILKRIIFLLRISCKEVDNTILGLIGNHEELNLSYVYTKPKGSGWESLIDLIYQKRKDFDLESLHYILPVLEEWCSHNKSGTTTKQVGLLSLKFYEDLFSTEDLVYSSDVAHKLVRVIISCSAEIKDELKIIYSKVIEEGGVERRESYYELCKILVSSDFEIIPAIRELPDLVIKFANLFWIEENKEKYRYGSSFGVEKYYSLSSHRDYFPASAFQTPTYLLLTFHFKKAIDFIIDFTNRSVEAYSRSGFDKHITQIELKFKDGRTSKQFISDSLWNMYRGGGSPVTPYLLQSIHMALEKILLEHADKEKPEILESWLLYILEKSVSASLSAVVASIVLAHPDKFFNVAKVLFTSCEVILKDKVRSIVGEHSAKSIYSIGTGLNYSHKRFEQERLNTIDDPYRKQSLEDLILRYQFFNIGDLSEDEFAARLDEIHNIIDQHSKNLPSEDKQTDRDKTTRLLLSRIDRRNMNPKIERQGENFIIDFNPKVEPLLVEHSKNALGPGDDFMKYSELKLWGIHKFEKRNDTFKSDKYENNPMLVLSETKELIESLSNGTRKNQILDHIIPGYTCSALLKEHFEELSEDDRNYCAEVILDYASLPLYPNYQYQISDGVEVAINTIPFLIERFEELKDSAFILLLILLDTHPIGQYKRVCDYSIEAINNSLWSISPNFSRRIIYGYLKIRTLYNSVEKELYKGSGQNNGWFRFSHHEVIEKLTNDHKEDIECIFSENYQFNSFNPVDYSLEDFQVVFSLIPYATNDEELLLFISKGLNHFSESLLKKENDVDFSTRNRIFSQYALFILHRDINDIERFVTPFTQNFSFSRETASFFQDIISMEDKVEKYEQFWTVWQLFYPHIKNIQSAKGYYRSEVIHNYLLAWNYWRESAKEWHSLKTKEKKFYKTVVEDIGNLPEVFDAVAQFLNEIGSVFLNEGILWISELAKKNNHNKLEKNTIYYVEKLIRKYVYLNRSKVKQDLKTKQKVLVILNFLIERGSVNAYLLREDII